LLLLLLLLALVALPLVLVLRWVPEMAYGIARVSGRRRSMKEG